MSHVDQYITMSIETAAGNVIHVVVHSFVYRVVANGRYIGYRYVSKKLLLGC